MKRLVTCALFAFASLLVSGCPIAPSQTTIQLVNSGDSQVDVVLYVGSSQYTTKDLLRLFGDEIQRTLLANETTTIRLDCDNLQAVFIDNAAVNIIGGLGPEEEGDLLLDGTDFGCGDTIRLTFTYTVFNLDINVSYPVQS